MIEITLNPEGEAWLDQFFGAQAEADKDILVYAPGPEYATLPVYRVDSRNIGVVKLLYP